MVILDTHHPNSVTRTSLLDLDNQPPLVVEPHRMLMRPFSFQPFEVEGSEHSQVSFIRGVANDPQCESEGSNHFPGKPALLLRVPFQFFQVAVRECNIQLRPLSPTFGQLVRSVNQNCNISRLRYDNYCPEYHISSTLPNASFVGLKTRLLRKVNRSGFGYHSRDYAPGPRIRFAGYR